MAATALVSSQIIYNQPPKNDCAFTRWRKRQLTTHFIRSNCRFGRSTLMICLQGNEEIFMLALASLEDLLCWREYSLATVKRRSLVILFLFLFNAQKSIFSICTIYIRYIQVVPNIFKENNDWIQLTIEILIQLHTLEKAHQKSVFDNFLMKVMVFMWTESELFQCRIVNFTEFCWWNIDFNVMREHVWFQLIQWKSQN